MTQIAVILSLPVGRQGAIATKNLIRCFVDGSAMMSEKKGYVYILTNKGHNVLYTGVTSDLVKRVYEHKNKFVEGFTKKYNLDQLVYYEMFENIENAIQREKQIKGLLRSKKIALIEQMNPQWEDLYLKLL